jgi:flagellar FliL protein
MAEDDDLEGAENGEDGQAKKPGKKKLILFAALGLILLLGAGAGVYFSGLLGASDEEIAAQVPEPAYFYELPELTVNLSAAEKRAQFLKIQVALELKNEELVQQIEPLMPRILDAFQTYLRELRVSDLEGSSGIYRLKQELQRRINLAIHPARVEAVLFREIIIQ